MHKCSRFALLLFLIVGALPHGADAGPIVLSFKPQISGAPQVNAPINYRLPDGLHLDIVWHISANAAVKLAKMDPVTARDPSPNPPDVKNANKNFSKWEILPNQPLRDLPANGDPLDFVERVSTDGPYPKGAAQRWELGVNATDEFGKTWMSKSDSESVFVDIYDSDMAVDINGGTVGTAVTAATLGWQFTTSKTQNIAALGFWDESPNGIGSHTVALWNVAGGAPLAQLTIDATGDPFPTMHNSGRWIFAYLPVPVSIAPGSYVMGATYAAGDPDPFRLGSLANPLGLTVAQGLTIDGSRKTTGSVVSTTSDPEFPDLFVPGESAYFGPNFLIDPIPEPSSIVLALIGGSMIAFKAWRRRQAKAISVTLASNSGSAKT
ncbi:MAG: DUF4082 domain-containing protein [Planctomycetota bacterium]|nr:DUF4082 domain-containing protein [Planctomycetota bacterium]